MTMGPWLDPIPKGKHMVNKTKRAEKQNKKVELVKSDETHVRFAIFVDSVERWMVITSDFAGVAVGIHNLALLGYNLPIVLIGISLHLLSRDISSSMLLVQV